MHKIIKANLPITRFVLPRKDALELMKIRARFTKSNLSKNCPKAKKSVLQTG